jgi:two-component system response regulator FixJ
MGLIFYYFLQNRDLPSHSKCTQVESVVSERLSGTVFIVDDDPLLRSSLEVTLNSAGLKTEKFASAAYFLTYLTPLHVGCLLVDLRMPGIDGLELQTELALRNAPISAIIMTGYADVALAVRAIKGGALDVLEKPFKRTQLLCQVASGLALAREKLARIRATETSRARLNALTDREREVVKLLLAGQTNKEIARALGLSPRTVEIHRARVMEKLDVSNLPALVRMAG